jgi:DNA-binding MarR family transcriptional regulator
MRSKSNTAVADDAVGAASRREKRVLRKLLYIDQHRSKLGEDTLAMTRLVNFNKDMIDKLKVSGLIELSASVADGRLDWHVRLSTTGRAVAETLGAMRPIAPAMTAARRLEQAGGTTGRPGLRKTRDPERAVANPPLASDKLFKVS